MITIPLTSTPSQLLQVTLADQSCNLAVYQKTTGLLLDLSVSGTPIVSALLCHDRTLLIRYPYLGFVGDLSFVDTEGLDDPYYTGLGSRWLLVYLSPDEASVVP